MRRILFLIASFCLLAASAVRAQAPDRAALHAALDAGQLASDPGWRSLLHLTGSETESPVVDDWFFLAPGGRRDAGAELHATLDALLDDRPIHQRDETAPCVFPARYRFLAAHLGSAITQAAPMPVCERRQRWMKGLAAEQLWVVFPSGYLNSPSSMFGHTLLRVDSAESRTRGPLLAYAANFVAETNESNGLIFAIKGLAGGYTGAYGVLPYYEKVKEYVRMESRDLWEYPLQLDAGERQQVLEHLWELRGAHFTYYFFTRNCAYQLLTLLQTVRPQQDLTSGFSLWAIPTDTLRRLQALGWLGPPRFRPALESTLRADATEAGAAQQSLIAALAAGERDPQDGALAALPAQTRARVLDVAHNLVYLRFQAGAPREPLLEQDRRLLAARAGIAGSSEFAPVPVPETPPHEGHSTQRAGFGVAAEEGELDLSARYRFAYHDLLDDPAGYTPGAQIDFGEFELRHRPGSGSVKLQDFKLIEIHSLAPRSLLLSPISWRVSTGARRDLDADAPLRGYLEGGPGLARPWGASLLYGFAPASFESGSGLRDGYALRGGLELGAWLPLAPHLRAQADAQWLGHLAGDTRARLTAGLALQAEAFPAWALRLDLRGEQLGSPPAQGRIALTALLYF